MMQTVHQIWVGAPMPEREAAWVQSIRTAAAASGWEHRLWGMEELLQAYGKEPATALLARCMELLPTPTVAGLVSDYHRLRVLADAGGLYLDTDFDAPQGKLPALPAEGDVWGMPSHTGTAYANGAFWVRTPAAARALAEAAGRYLLTVLAEPHAADFPARLVELLRKDATRRGIAETGCGPRWLCTAGLEVLRAGGWSYALMQPPILGCSCHGAAALLVHHAGGAWRESGTKLWNARAREATLSALPLHLRPQGKVVRTQQGRAAAQKNIRELQRRTETEQEPAREKQRRSCTAAQVLPLPRGVRRVLIFSNVVQGWPQPELREGDLCFHINTARHAAEVMGADGVRHWLFCRHGAGRVQGRPRWYTPSVFDGFERVVFIDSAVLCAGMSWCAEWREKGGGKSASTGFMLANICRELWPQLPLVLVGFEPGVYHGTPLWGGHAWTAEAEWYAHKDFLLINPKTRQ